MSSRPEIWEKFDEETDKAYAAFLYYRNLGPDRSVAAAYESYRSKFPAQSFTAKRAEPWQHWSSRHQWKTRAGAWDMNQEKIAGKVQEDWMARQAHAAGRAMASLTELVANAADSKDIEELRKLVPKLTLLLGKGRAGDFILGIHKTLHGAPEERGRASELTSGEVLLLMKKVAGLVDQKRIESSDVPKAREVEVEIVE